MNSQVTMSSQAGTKRRGFASMSEEKQRMIASKGGKAAHQSGNAHEFTPDEARKAGRLGGHASAQSRRQSRMNDESDDEDV